MLGRAVRALFRDQHDVLGGGIALFAVLSFFPAVGAIVTIYSLAANPATISDQLSGLTRILPEEVASLIMSQLALAAARSAGELSVTLVITILIAMWSLRTAVDSVINVISRIFDGATACRTWVRRQGLSLLLATASVIASVVVIAAVIALPAIAAVVNLEGATRTAIEWLRWPFVLALAMGGLATIYRAAPCSARVSWRDVLPGAAIGAMAWLVVSFIVSVTVERLGASAGVPGVVGTIVVVMLWFYASSLTVLFGALFNAEKLRAERRLTS
ncbi:MAG TPA: YihY/virulence factor BrkB family protein [Kofleriaceae bacterium]|nr:YihY/virulence factor BrkB family protein [Kofleriaceae bacterium]